MDSTTDSIFWRRVATLVLLCPVIAGTLYGIVARTGYFDVTIPNDVFLVTYLPFCRPERGEHFLYYCSVLLPVASFSVMEWRDWPGVRWSKRILLLAASALILLLFDLDARQRGDLHFRKIEFARCMLLLLGAWLGTMGIKKHLQNVSVNRLRTLKMPTGLAALIALVATLTRLSPSLQTSRTLPLALSHVRGHFPFIYGEFAAILNGRVAGFDYFPQYQNLLPTLLKPLFLITPLSVGSFTVLMVVLSAVSLMAVFSALISLCRNATLALVLYLPFLSFSIATLDRAGDHYAGSYTYFPNGPLRYWIAFLSFYTLTRYRSERKVKWLWATAILAGFAALNSFDFGVATFLAAFAATVAVDRRRVFAGSVYVGCLIGVFSAWSVGSFLKSGSLINPLASGSFIKSFGLYGFNMLPIPYLGWHWMIYFILMATLLAGLRDARVNRDDPLTAALVFSACFGFFAGMYFVGRSHSDTLSSLFSVACLSLILLTLRNLKEFKLTSRVKTSTAALLLALISIHVLSIEYPNPLGQWRRLQQWDASLETANHAQIEMIKAHSAQGSDTEILYPFGFELANSAEVNNRFPFTQNDSLILAAQVQKSLDVLDHSSIHEVYGTFPDEFKRGIVLRGFSKVDEYQGFEVWSRVGS